MHKQFLSALLETEQKQNAYGTLKNYFTNNSAKFVIKLYCEGEKILPTFPLLKKLSLQWTIYGDFELNKLFHKAIKYSKAYYNSLYELIQEKNTLANFTKTFENKVQPLGQKLINIIISLRNRVKIVTQQLAYGLTIEKKILPNFRQKFHKLRDHLIYKLNVCKAKYAHIARLLYFFLVGIAVSGLSLANFLYNFHPSTLISVLINACLGLFIIIISILLYPFEEFEQRDISGQNLLALRYKALYFNMFNNNLKQIVDIQYKSGKAGQEWEEELELA